MIKDSRLRAKIAVAVGNMVREVRQCAGMSARELADKMGVAFQGVSANELGEKPIGFERLVVYAQTLGVLPSHLVAALDPLAPDTGFWMALMHRFAGIQCIDCDKPYGTYWVKDEVWDKVFPFTRSGCICVRCFEVRLRRPLTTEDFAVGAPCNDVFFFGAKISLRSPPGTYTDCL